MSAYVVGKAHIDALIRTALDGPTDAAFGWRQYGFRWVVPDEGERFGYRSTELTAHNASEVGQMLLDENVVSVGYRYSDSLDAGLPGPIDTAYRSPYTYTPGRRLTIAETFKAIDGLSYQSCEHPGWRDSEANAMLDSFRKQLASHLPGYDEADTWEVD